MEDNAVNEFSSEEDHVYEFQSIFTDGHKDTETTLVNMGLKNEIKPIISLRAFSLEIFHKL